MPTIGEGTPESPWRPKYLISEFPFFYKDQKIISSGVQMHYSLPDGTVELTIPDEMGKRLLSKFGVEAGGDVVYVSDETPEEAQERIVQAAQKAALEQKRREEAERIPF